MPFGDKYTLLAYTLDMHQDQPKKRSKKKTALKVGVGVMAFRYNMVGGRAKYTAQANLLKRDARMLRGAGMQLHSDFKGMHKGGQIAVGAAFAGAAGYAVYRNRDNIRRGAHWLNEQAHSKKRQQQAVKGFGRTLQIRGVGVATQGVRNRNARAFGYGAGQVVAGSAIVGKVQRNQKKRRKTLNG